MSAALRRWLRFNLVGVSGVALQLALLMLLSRFLSCLAATALAVELTVLHNFFWHESYTWRELLQRCADAGRSRPHRLLRFHLTNGLVSLLGNLALMKLLAVVFHFPLLVANLTSIVLCSLLNFCLAECWVCA